MHVLSLQLYMSDNLEHTLLHSNQTALLAVLKESIHQIVFDCLLEERTKSSSSHLKNTLNIMVSITCPVLKHPCLLFKNPKSQLSTLISRPYTVHCCQGNGDSLDKGERFHKEQRNHKLSSLWVAGIIGITAISATQESLAQMLGSQQGGAIFQKACIGCHYEGGNILQSGATLTIRDLERNGIATVEDIFNLTYYGKGRMPGFGEKCTPRGQCTFGPRLSDEDIRLLAEYVKAQADQGWPKLEHT